MGGIGASRKSKRRLGDWDEIELVECVCEGTDAELMGLACAELFRRHDDGTRRAVESAFRRCGLPLTDVEDVVNVIRLRIVESLPELRDRSRLRAWCCSLGRNAAIDHIRSLLRRRFFDVESLGGCHGDEECSEQAWLPRGTRWDAAEIELIEGIDLPRRLERALAALAPRERQAFHLFYEVGLKYERIAEKMGIVSDTVGALLSGAREKFFRAWADGA
jgi:RNA polymerase sigma factor (sigma-70 family)